MSLLLLFNQPEAPPADPPGGGWYRGANDVDEEQIHRQNQVVIAMTMALVTSGALN